MTLGTRSQQNQSSAACGRARSGLIASGVNGSEVLMQRLLPAVITIVLASAACGELPEPKVPDDLIDYIKSVETAEIRESWGEQAGQCFTWEDYTAFVPDRRPAALPEPMKGPPQFQNLPALIRTRPPDDRERLVARSRPAAR